MGNSPWYYNPLLFFGLRCYIFHTAYYILHAQEHVCLFCYSKPESEKKKKTILLNCLLWLWLRNVTPRDELLAQLSPMKCVLLVTDWECIWVCIAHLHSFHNGQSLILQVLYLPIHAWYSLPDCWLPAACRTPEKLSLTVLIYISMVLGF